MSPLASIPFDLGANDLQFALREQALPLIRTERSYDEFNLIIIGAGLLVLFLIICFGACEKLNVHAVKVD